MMTEHEPSYTRLINIPVNFNNKPYKLLIYTNDLAVNNKNNVEKYNLDAQFNNSQFNPRPLSYNSFESVYSNKKNYGALMIVPVPNVYSIDNNTY